MSEISAFKIYFTDHELDKIKIKVVSFPWHEMPHDGGWQYGTNLSYLKNFSNYWVNNFDWRKQENKLNQFKHFKTKIDGIDIHFIHEKGSGENPRPLIISHGWPGSISEFVKIIEPLAHPERFGGRVEDAFDIVAPSLPGFGFSGKPSRPFGPRKMAEIFHTLMTERLGYSNYIAQGGDWGGAISSWLGFDYPEKCIGIHINILTMRHPAGPRGEEEEKWAASFNKEQVTQNGYRTQQATKPQTLSYAMMDSPVGTAAWIVEKFHSWSDIEDNDIESVYTKDELLTNIMIYILTKTFNTASWIYYGREEEGGRILSPEGKRVEVPTGCALFPEELLSWPPKSYVERLYNIKHWSVMPNGGHFAAMEQPKLLIDDIRSFSRKL